MDESWRMRMGMGIGMEMPTYPHRKSTEGISASARRSAASAGECLNPDDFSDVFGGPPRSVISRKFSGENIFDRSVSFYEEIFRPANENAAASPMKASGFGRKLLAFRIPASRNEGFYGDVFRTSSMEPGGGGGGGGRMSRDRSRPGSNAKSKSDSASSVLSSEDVSPFRPVVGDDVALNSFASKLRPINIPCKWNTEQQPKRKGMPAYECARPSFVENDYAGNSYYQNLESPYRGFSRQISSPEAMNLEAKSYQSIKISTDEWEQFNSPASLASPASSLCQETPPNPERGYNKQSSYPMMMQEQDDDEEDDEVMSSYVIEINSDYREGTSGGDVSIDDAIAWAKETYQRHSPESQGKTSQSSEMDHQNDRSTTSQESFDRQSNGNRTVYSSKEEEQKGWTVEEEKEEKSDEQLEMELLDEDIKLWSSGKETNIRLLLSTIHHILWPNSGWCAIPSISLIESSQVKKAYQKARLCLHPDKLQQRGATPLQKHIAEKAFTILQGAWAAFISQDDFF